MNEEELIHLITTNKRVKETIFKIVTQHKNFENVVGNANECYEFNKKMKDGWLHT